MSAQDIILKSKITLSRNVRGYQFPSRLRDTRANIIANGVYEAVAANGGYDLYKMAQISDVKSRRLREDGLISDRLLASPYGSVIVSDDKSVAVMINEEDNVVEQCFSKGLSLEEAYSVIDAIDDKIAGKQEFCFHPKLGYLTSCPDSVGTGMHASVTLFLPALTLSKSLEQCIAAVSRLNVSLKSVYDENIEAYLYTVTNQDTLGVTEKEIIDLVTTAANHLAEAEERARKMLKISSEAEVRDKSMRSMGILKNAYKISAAEMLQLITWAKIGAYYGFISPDCDKMDELAEKLLPAAVSEAVGDSGTDSDIYRAEILRKSL